MVSLLKCPSSVILIYSISLSADVWTVDDDEVLHKIAACGSVCVCERERMTPSCELRIQMTNVLIQLRAEWPVPGKHSQSAVANRLLGTMSDFDLDHVEGACAWYQIVLGFLT